MLDSAVSPSPPDWLLWLRNIAAIIAVGGAFLHYNLKRRNQRIVKVSVFKFFRKYRTPKFRILHRSAVGILSGFRRVYGESLSRMFLTSLVLCVLYSILIVSLVMHVASEVERTRAEKRNVERAVDEYIYDHPDEVQRAYTARRVGVMDDESFEYVYDDPGSQNLRRRAESFEEKYRERVLGHPLHGRLAILTLLEGTYRDPGFKWFTVACMLLFNVIIDFLSVFITLSMLEWVTMNFRMRSLLLGSLIVFGATILLFYSSLLSYNLFFKGDTDAIIMVLIKLPLAIFFFVGGGVGIVSNIVALLRGDENVKNATISVAVSSIMVIIAFPFLVEYVQRLRLGMLPPLSFHDEFTWITYLVAGSTVIPASIIALFMVLTFLFSLISKTLLTPVLWYLRMVVRMPVPILVTISAMPAAILEFICKSYPELYRLLVWLMVN